MAPVALVSLVNLVVLLPQEPPAALSVPATTKMRRGRDVGSLPAPFASPPALERLKGPPHLGYDTHRGARLPILARNHLHSSQDIAWFALRTKGGGHTLSCVGRLGCRQAVS